MYVFWVRLPSSQQNNETPTLFFEICTHACAVLAGDIWFSAGDQTFKLGPSLQVKIEKNFLYLCAASFAFASDAFFLRLSMSNGFGIVLSRLGFSANFLSLYNFGSSRDSLRGSSRFSKLESLLDFLPPSRLTKTDPSVGFIGTAVAVQKVVVATAADCGRERLWRARAHPF